MHSLMIYQYLIRFGALLFMNCQLCEVKVDVIINLIQYVQSRISKRYMIFCARKNLYLLKDCIVNVPACV